MSESLSDVCKAYQTWKIPEKREWEMKSETFFFRGGELGRSGDEKRNILWGWSHNSQLIHSATHEIVIDPV